MTELGRVQFAAVAEDRPALNAWRGGTLALWSAAYVALGLADWLAHAPFHSQPWHPRVAIGVACALIYGPVGIAVTAAAEAVMALTLMQWEPWPQGLLQAAGLTAVVATATLALRRLRFDRRLGQVRDMAALVLAGAMAPAAVGVVLHRVLSWLATRATIDPGASLDFVATAAPGVTVLPVILLWWDGALRQWRASPRQHRIHTIIVYGFAVATTIISFYVLVIPTESTGVRQFKFLTLLPIVWAAMRLGLFETAFLTCLTNGAAIINTMLMTMHRARAGQALRADYSDVEPFMMTAALVGLFIATLRRVEDRIRYDLERSTEDLTESKDRFRQIVMQAPVPMLLQIGGIIQFANPQMVRLLGAQSEQELIGSSGYDLVPPEDHELLRLWLKESQQHPDRAGQPMDVRWVRRDGTVIDVRVTSGPFRIGDQSGATVVAIDISQSKRMEQTLRDRETRYRSIASVTSDAIWDWDIINDTITWSDSANRLLDHKPTDITSWRKWWQTELRGDDRDRVLRTFHEAVDSDGDAWEQEYSLDRGDGQATIVFARAVIVRNDKGKAVRMIGAMTDVTRQRLAETTLRQSEERFRVLLQMAPVAIFLSQQGRIVFANPAMAQLLGADRAEHLSGEPVVTPFMPEDRPEMDQQLQQVEEHQRELSAQLATWLRYDGAMIQVMLSASPCVIGGQRGVQIVARDVTEEIRARREVARLHADLERRVAERTAQLSLANRELESFSYSVSHDLRAPLRAIDGFSRAVIEDYGPQIGEQGRRDLERVREASQRMAQLIDDMLALARVTRADLTVRRADMSAMAQEIVEHLRRVEPHRNVSVVIESGLIVDADPGLLRIAVENLLNNAWKFTSRRDQANIRFGRLQPELPDSTTPTYYVRDDGAGFDMRFSDKLFGVFQRLHTIREFPGTGVGLATVQRIIHRHHGQVWADATPDQGATFFFNIPHRSDER